MGIASASAPCSNTQPLDYSTTGPLPLRDLINDRRAGDRSRGRVVADLDRDAGPAHVGDLAARLVVIGAVVRTERGEGRHPPARTGDGDEDPFQPSVG